MELRQIEYFVAVAEHLHFGRAAAALSIGQPAVSQQIARLERTLGTPLLDRSPRTVRLTEAGARFLPHARAVLAAVETATAAVLDPATSTGRPLRLGAAAGLGERLSRFLDALARIRPGVSVELTNIPTRPRLERVAAGQLDAAFVRGAVVAEGVEQLEIWQDALVAALPARHALAEEPPVRVAELAALPLRIVPRRTNPALVDLVLGCCADVGRAPRCLEHDDGPVESLLATIAFGAASWTVLYESHARMLKAPGIAFLPTDPSLRMSTYLAIPEGVRSRAVAPLLEACAVAASLESTSLVAG